MTCEKSCKSSNIVIIKFEYLSKENYPLFVDRGLSFSNPIFWKYLHIKTQKENIFNTLNRIKGLHSFPGQTPLCLCNVMHASVFTVDDINGRSYVPIHSAMDTNTALAFINQM